MSGFNKADVWAGSSAVNPQSGNIEVRAMDIARIIAERPSLVVFSRRNPITKETYQLPPQVVRLEIERSFAARDETTDKMENALSIQHVTVIGYKNHPTIPNTDVIRADRFYFDNQIWEISDLYLTVPDRLLASASLKP